METPIIYSNVTQILTAGNSLFKPHHVHFPLEARVIPFSLIFEKLLKGEALLDKYFDLLE